MAKRLFPTTSDAAIALATAAATLPFPPVAGQIANVPDGWTHSEAGVVPEFDLEVWSTGTLSLTSGELFGAKLRALIVADFTFTANASTDQIAAVAHGLVTGDGPLQFTNAGGALPAGLATSTNYWVVYIDADHFKVATSLANALAGAIVDITGAGTGTHTAADVTSTARAYWESRGQIATPISLTNQRAYSVRCDHSPAIIAYALAATLSAGTVSATITPVQER